MVFRNNKTELNFHQILATIPVLLIRFMIGFGVGWVVPMLYESTLSALTSDKYPWIVTGDYLIRGLSPFLIFLILDKFGRNTTLIFIAVIASSLWILIFFSRSDSVHHFVRLIFSGSVGSCGAVASIYIGENCSPKMRGIFNGLSDSFFYIGELIAFSLTAYLSSEWVAIIGGYLGFIVVLSTCLLKEPAQYLIMKGHLTKAENNYDYLYDLKKSKTRFEFKEIKQYINEVKTKNEKNSLIMLRSPEVLKSLRVVVIVNFLALAGGFSVVNSFATMVLALSENEFSPAHMTVLIGLVRLSSISLLSPFMDTFNRRTLLLLFSALVATIHAFQATLYYAALIYDVPYFPWPFFGSFTIFACLDGPISLLTTTITGELLPQNVKAIGSSLAVVSGSLGGLLADKIFEPIVDSVGMYVNYILFMFVNIFMFLYVYYDLPETKAKTLVEIQRKLNRR